MPLHAGLDWGATCHAVCVIDEGGAIRARIECPHTRAGLADLLARLKRLGPPAELPIAIERPSGLVVETLVAAGHPVVPIHPNVVKACRPRYRAAGGKSDPGDAYMLADILRTDGHRFAPLTPASDDIKALRALVRGRDDLLATRVGLANQLRALLDSFWPGAAAVFAAVDSPIALAFLDRYPTPGSAGRLGPKRMRAFMAQHRYCGRRSAEDLIERLRAAPAGLAGDAEADAKGELVRALVRSLATLVGAIAELTSRIEHAVADLPDGRIVMSFPRAGRVNAAQILAEIGDVRARFQSEDQLAAEAGVSPVTHASGKSRGVVFRFACNHRLRAAVTCWADNSRHACAWAAERYAKARGRGCDHPHAVRILARAWLRVLWRAWTDRKPYDPALHGAAVKLAA
jgi:transposase